MAAWWKAEDRMIECVDRRMNPAATPRETMLQTLERVVAGPALEALGFPKSYAAPVQYVPEPVRYTHSGRMVGADRVYHPQRRR